VGRVQKLFDQDLDLQSPVRDLLLVIASKVERRLQPTGMTDEFIFKYGIFGERKGLVKIGIQRENRVAVRLDALPADVLGVSGEVFVLKSCMFF
jgi:hypothetical protein